jgi:hypothetical protein
MAYGQAPTLPSERVPVIVELFTSEGCSSCPPADTVLTKLTTEQPVSGAHIIGLGEHVDYWDRLGWRDPFSSPLFSKRQSDYAKTAFKGGVVYTPQLVVDGREEVIGGDERAATGAVARALLERKIPVRISLERQRRSNPIERPVRIEIAASAGASGAAADVMVAVTEDGLVTQVQRGENGGRELRHSAVVRSLTRAGVFTAGSRPWSATTMLRIPSSWDSGRLRVVVFVQDQGTRKIVGAATVPFAAAF